MSEASISSPGLAKQVWRRIAPLLVINAVYFGILVYPILRIRMLLDPEAPGTPALLAIMVGPLLGRLSYEFYPSFITRWLAALSLTWLGVCFMGFMLVIAFEVTHWLVPLTDFMWGAILTGSLTCLALFAFQNAQRLNIREVSITAAGAPDGLRIAQISDVHVGSRSGRFLSRVVADVNRQAPDYVLITGDLIDFSDISSREIHSLSELQAPTFFIIGNHERYVDLEAICERLRGLGITVIRNATINVGPLQLIGIDDAEPKTQVGKVLKTLEPDPDAFRILLYHRPDGAEDAASWGAQMMLCGHTHNGQIVPFNFIVRRIFPRIQGLYPVSGMQLYVSPGTGTWGPILRLGSRSEISMFTLHDARSESADTHE